jgi:hypothetical protein
MRNHQKPAEAALSLSESSLDQVEHRRQEFRPSASVPRRSTLGIERAGTDDASIAWIQ